jgi:hypothetical protein
MFLLEERQLRPNRDIEEWINELVATAFPNAAVQTVISHLKCGGREQTNAEYADKDEKKLPSARAHARIDIDAFSRDELDEYLSLRCEGIARKSAVWLEKAADILWEQTGGEVSRQSCGKLRTYTLQKYVDTDAKLYFLLSLL